MIDKLIKSTIFLFLLLFPLYFLPFPNTSVESDKQILLVFFAFFLFLFLLVRVYLAKAIKIVRTPADLSLLGFFLFFLLSNLLIPGNKIAAFFSPFGLLTVSSLVLLFFTLTHLTYHLPLTAGHFFPPLLFSSIILSLLLLFSQLKILPQITPLGGLLPTFSFLLIIGTFLIVDLLLHLRENIRFTLIKVVSFSLLLSGLGILVFHLLSDQPPLLLPFPFGWTIMMEMFKNLSYFLFGVGPGNYPFAYALGKPVSLNSTAFWDITSSTGPNLPLTLATEIGAPCALLFLFLFLKSLTFKNSPYQFSLIIAFILQLLFPSSLSLFILTFLLLSFLVPKKEVRGKEIQVVSNRLVRSLSFLIILLLPLILAVFLAAKFYLSDVFFRKALSLAGSDRAGEAYTFSEEAIALGPQIDRPYVLSSTLSLGLAQMLLKDKETTESAKRQMISQFINQSVDHARQAAGLNSLHARNWAQLAQVYQSLTGFVEGAEQQSLDAYSKQMSLDPNSPQPKVGAAGLLLILAGKSEATQSAQLLAQANNLLLQAINLKPDWNNARYNMAVLFRMTGRNEDAAAELQRTLDLTSPESSDYQRIQAELREVKSFLPKEATPSSNQEATPSSNLSPTPIPCPTRPPSS